jgi:hypothetical protein
VCRGVLGIESANPLNEGLHASLLEDTHERRSQSLGGIRGHLGNGSLVGGTLLDVAASNLLKLEVSCDIGRDENVGQFARGHEELGNKVDVPVVEATILFPGLLAFAEVTVLLKKLYPSVRGRS